jgi:hypothetical protein
MTLIQSRQLAFGLPLPTEEELAQALHRANHPGGRAAVEDRFDLCRANARRILRIVSKLQQP